jgi:DNA-binding IclR family transcriptional regulator
LTANKLAELSGLPLTTVRPRLTHLAQIGKIEDSGQRIRISKRTSAILWRLT